MAVNIHSSYCIQPALPFILCITSRIGHVMLTNKMAALEEEKLTINEEYAKRYEQKKRAEELSKREDTTFLAMFLPFQSH